MNKGTLGIAIAALLLISTSCVRNQSNQLTAVSFMGNVEDTPVNPIEQALPTIMVIPSDDLLKKQGLLSTVSIDGVSYFSRDYDGFMTASQNNSIMVSMIQNEFVARGYYLQDLGQSLKRLGSLAGTDMADDLAKDAKTVLLSTVHPDIIAELDYSYAIDPMASDLKQVLSFTFRFIDAYTSKVFSTHTFSKKDENISNAMTVGLKKEMKGISEEIKAYFSDIVYKGREINVRVAVANKSRIKLSDDSIYGEPLSDWIMDYMKVHSKKGAYNMQINTDNELSFSNVRISVLNPDGTQFAAYDWAREFCSAFRKECGVVCSNKSRGLGEVLITINGVK